MYVLSMYASVLLSHARENNNDNNNDNYFKNFTQMSNRIKRLSDYILSPKDHHIMQKQFILYSVQ